MSRTPHRWLSSRILTPRTCVFVTAFILATGSWFAPQRVAAGEALTMSTLLELGREGVDADIILSLVQRDCVAFEVTAEAVLELTEAVPKAVIQEAIECRERSGGSARSASRSGSQNNTSRDYNSRSYNEEDDSPSSAVPVGDLDPKRLAVLTFSGTSTYRGIATETLVAELVQATDLDIVEPDEPKQSGGRSYSYYLNNRESISAGEAKKVAAEAGARYAILGDINAYRGNGTYNALATLKLVDVESGKILSVVQKKGGLLLAYTLQDSVVQAVKRAVRQLAPELPRQ